MPPNQKYDDIIIPQKNYKNFLKNYAELMKNNPRKTLLYRVGEKDSYKKIASFFWLRKAAIERIKRKTGHLYAGKNYKNSMVCDSEKSDNALLQRSACTIRKIQCAERRFPYLKLPANSE